MDSSPIITDEPIDLNLPLARPGARTGLPETLKREQLVAVIDSREQTPFDLSPLQTVTDTLPTGDYSVRGLQHVVAIERKSEGDLLASVGVERDRFEREVARLLAYPVRALVIESTWQRIESGNWRSRVTPTSAGGSLLGWVAAGLPVIMVGDHATAGRYVSRLLYIAARRWWREAWALVGNVLNTDRRGYEDSGGKGKRP